MGRLLVGYYKNFHPLYPEYENKYMELRLWMRASYFERLEFESPLDIKLRSDVLSKSVLFIGYGSSDINLRFLFYKLAKLWKVNSYGVAQLRSYILSDRPNPVQEAVLDQWGITMITSNIDEPGKALTEFLEGFV